MILQYDIIHHMGMKCDNCQKGVLYGHAVSHAKNRTKRLFKPNLHFIKVMIAGKMERMRLCTKCSRMLKKETKEKVTKPQASVAAIATA